MKYTFPKTFKFGVGDADLQVIGEQSTRTKEGAEETMWSYFARTSGKCIDSPDLGVDRYHLWKQDVELMKRLGIKHYRTSISMSRVLKKNGDVNPKAIEWYRNYFKELKKTNISLYATLYHWELPQFLSEKGGWKNKETIDFYIKHVQAVVQNLHEFVDEYFVFNESRHASIRGYYEGLHAPGENDLKGALQASHNMLVAQGLATREIMGADKKSKVSTVLALSPSYGINADEKNIEAARLSNSMKNLWFADPFFLGTYPEEALEVYGKNVPKISSEDLKIAKVGHLFHSIGVNYYKGSMVEYDAKNERKFKEVTPLYGLKNNLGWPVFFPPEFPEGLYDILCQMYYSYKDFGLKRLYVTENGTAQQAKVEEGKVHDGFRTTYLEGHLRQVYKALQRGIPVNGYFVWTLMDNYEWPDGYREESRFGIVYVDRKTMKRIPKESAYWYKKLISSKTLTI